MSLQQTSWLGKLGEAVDHLNEVIELAEGNEEAKEHFLSDLERVRRLQGRPQQRR